MHKSIRALQNESKVTRRKFRINAAARVDNKPLCRCVVHLRCVNWIQRMQGRTRHALVSPHEDSAVPTFVRLTCSNHDHEKPISSSRCLTPLVTAESRAAQTSRTHQRPSEKFPCISVEKLSSILLSNRLVAARQNQETPATHSLLECSLSLCL